MKKATARQKGPSDDTRLRKIAELLDCSTTAAQTVYELQARGIQEFLRLVQTDDGFRNQQIRKLLFTDSAFAKAYVKKNKLNTREVKSAIGSALKKHSK